MRFRMVIIVALMLSVLACGGTATQQIVNTPSAPQTAAPLPTDTLSPTTPIPTVEKVATVVVSPTAPPATATPSASKTPTTPPPSPTLPPSATPSPVGKLEVSGNVSQEKTGDFVILHGLVKNSGTKAAKFVQVEARTFKDGQLFRVESGFTQPIDIGPGETASFKLYTATGWITYTLLLRSQ